jgi:hypothetical protein
MIQFAYGGVVLWRIRLVEMYSERRPAVFLHYETERGFLYVLGLIVAKLDVHVPLKSFIYRCPVPVVPL